MSLLAQRDSTLNSQDSLKTKALDLLRTSVVPPVDKRKTIQIPEKIGEPVLKDFKADDNTAVLKNSKPGQNTVQFNVNKITSLKNDSATEKKFHLKEKLKSIFPKGIISVGYDYGFLPYTVNTVPPASAFKTEGSVETDLLNIPIDISYFYTTQKNLIGLTNYFRISYNADRYKDKLNHKLSGNSDSYKNILGGLKVQRQQLLQKMAYADYLSSIDPDKWPKDAITGKGKPAPLLLMPDTSGMLKLPQLDTAGMFNSSGLGDTPGNNTYYSKADSIKRKTLLYKQRADSMKQLYATYKNNYEVLNDSIKKVQEKIDALENLKHTKSLPGKSPYLNKVQGFLSGLKKADVGLCYPGYSTFLTNNIPVRGLNFEYQKNGLFFGFTYGTTVSTLLYNNKSLDGILQNIKNAYNYFDANNLSAGRKILCTKFGIGEKDGDHLYVGFLVGKGANTYFLSGSGDAASRLTESNLVLEADIRRKLLKHTFLDVVVGKSSLQQDNLNMDVLQSAAREVFSNYRSYAILVKLKTSIPLTRSELTLSTRRIDPFFNSFGIGFIRSDNLRYELKLDQPLGKAFRYTLMFRYEEDNLLKLLNYKNTFYSINNTLSFKIKKGLMLRAGYTPLVRTLNGENYHATNKNAIVTGIITFTPRSRHVQKQFSLLYNYYFVNTDSSAINFQNFAYSQQFSFKSGFKTGLNISWFKNSLKDTTGNNVFLAVLDAGYQFRGGSGFSLAGKAAYKPGNRLYPGFIVKSTIKLSGSLFWENQAEKFIVGDLFNGYDLQNLKRFPYCFTTKLILNF